MQGIEWRLEIVVETLILGLAMVCSSPVEESFAALDDVHTFFFFAAQTGQKVV
jgi:hypothetical protein